MRMISLFVTILVLASCISAGAVTYTISDLGTLGGTYTYSYSINNSGWITGVSQTSYGSYAAFLRSNGNMTDLGTLGGSFNWGLGISDSGFVTGYSETTDWESHAFLSKDGSMQDVGGPGGGYSTAYAVNNSGEIVGISYNNMGQNTAFSSIDGIMTYLPDLGIQDSQAYAINNLGQIVGRVTGPDGRYRAVLWQDGGITDLGITGTANAINDLGEIVGLEYAPNITLRAFLWINGQKTVLEGLGGSSSIPHDINIKGQIVGQSSLLDGRTVACIWENGICTDLNSFILPDSGWELIEATGINDDGDITGWGYYNWQTCSFLLSSQRKIMVRIDVRPGDPTNRIILKDNGNVQVALLAAPADNQTEYFDVTQVDLSSITFAGAPIDQSNGRYAARQSDIDMDGYNDLLLSFSPAQLQLQPGDTSAKLSGKTSGGLDMEGSDAIEIVVKKNKR